MKPPTFYWSRIRIRYRILFLTPFCNLKRYLKIGHIEKKAKFGRFCGRGRLCLKKQRGLVDILTTRHLKAESPYFSIQKKIMSKNSSRRTTRIYSLRVSFLTILWCRWIMYKKTTGARRYTSDTVIESWRSILFNSDKIFCVRTHPEELLACVLLEHSFWILSWWGYITPNKSITIHKYTSVYNVFSMIVAVSSPGWVPGMSSWMRF